MLDFHRVGYTCDGSLGIPVVLWRGREDLSHFCVDRRADDQTYGIDGRLRQEMEQTVLGGCFKERYGRHDSGEA